MEGRCRTCKWWVAADWYSGGSRECTHLEEPDSKAEVVVRWGTGDSNAYLFTDPEFGCVHWEAGQEGL